MDVLLPGVVDRGHKEEMLGFVTFHGAELIQDSKVELSCGRKYGLIGVNGSGKSSFLAVLGKTQMIFLPIMSVK